MVPRSTRRRVPLGPRCWHCRLSHRLLISFSAFIILTALAWLARPHPLVYGRESTPTPLFELAPHTKKTPPFPIETPPGTLPTLAPTATPLPPTAKPPPIPIETPTELPTLPPGEPTTATPTATPPVQGPLPNLLITEFLADPDAVGDRVGEWIEIYNADATAVNLRDWLLADLGANRHRIADDLMIQPGQYLVLGRSNDPQQNGGVAVAYAYSGFDLSNGDDEILLLAPDEREAARVVWGAASSLSVSPGVSLERTGLNPGASWVVAWQAWPGSAGDLGSPGAPYVANPNPEPMPSPPEPEPTVAPPPQPDCTTVIPPPDARLYVSEFLANPAVVEDSVGEWIELYNAGASAVDLRCWILSDFGGDSHTIQNELLLQPGAYLVLARDGDPARNGGVSAAYVYSGMSLGNGSDEVRLLAPDGTPIDEVRWGAGVLTTIPGASLERTGFGEGAGWATAWQAWPGSAGDWGSPGAGYVANPNPDPEPPPGPEPTAVPPPDEPPVPPITGPLPRIFISEFLANPDAVSDAAGEWIELYNADTVAVNLRGWRIADLGTDGHTIREDVTLAPGQYLVFGRSAERSENGGVDVAYVYASMSLSNGDDEILLLAPGGREADRVVWGAGVLATTSGASLERTGFGEGAGWVTAWQAWPGSAGDWGSPGAGYVANPNPDPEPPPGPEPTAVPPPDEPPVPPITGPLPRIFISEFLANPDAVSDAAGEWIELYNADTVAVNLRGWRIADLGTDGHTIREDVTLAPGQYLVFGRSAERSENGGVDVAYVYASMSLSNGDDEILLLAPGGREADRVVWGAGVLATIPGASLERTGFGGGAGWATAWQAWPGSAGDWGSPGAGYVANPNPDPEPPPGPEPTAVPPPDEPPVPPITGPLPRIFISEFLANPDAVSDAAGEWIELYNADTVAVNLRGWRIADLGTDGHTIREDVTLAPGQYLVFGRSAERSENGGVDVAYVYASMSLSNGDDEILLLAPGGREADRVVWGAGVLATIPGASLERTGFGGGAGWATAWQAWPGSAGDWGSPGAGYVANPNPDPEPPPGPEPTAVPPPDEPPVPPITGPLPRIFISEFLANPDAVSDAAGEWIELYNADTVAVNLRGWRIADEDDDSHTISEDLFILPTQYLVLARNGERTENGGVGPAYVYASLSLGNGEDELQLIVPGDRQTDIVRWGGERTLTVRAGISLERSGFEDGAPWAEAWQAWPGSAGDLGTPGAAYIPPPDEPPPTAEPTISPTVTPPPGGERSRILISEFLADPDAAPDETGEWFELYNPGRQAVNLRGWQIADLGSDRHIIDADLIVAPGSYAVLGRNDDIVENGGVSIDYVYTGLSLANGDDELLLWTPDEQEVDRVLWGDGGLSTTRGASLQRRLPDDLDSWFVSTMPWPGSTGDLGTPGEGPGDLPPPEPSPTVTPPPDSGATWPLAAQPGPLILEEVAFRSSDREFVAVVNAGGTPVSLAGWRIGDAERVGDGEGMYALPEQVTLAPGVSYVIARNGETFRNHFGTTPDAQFEESAADVPVLTRSTELATGRWALSDSGDEVVLLNPQGAAADAVVYGGGDYAALTRRGELRPPGDFSLQHVADLEQPVDPTQDQRHRFLYAPPRPWEQSLLPVFAPANPVFLDDGYRAAWGSLGARSNFTSGFTAPPRYLAAAAGAGELDFVVLADQDGVTRLPGDAPLLTLPAWRWEDDGENAAVVFFPRREAVATVTGLRAWLERTGAYALWLDGRWPGSERIRAVDGNGAIAPGGLRPLLTLWDDSVGNLLPAGSSNPPLPGRFVATPRYTGLAVSAVEEAAIMEAIAQRRGWLSSTPGLWLTLQATAGSDSVWMGGAVDSANTMSVRIEYGDRTGEVAGLALWRNDRPLRQLDVPAEDGVWALTVPALPGSRYFAVATQTDGDFAVTAPILVRGSGAASSVRLDEVVFAPNNDFNGDGIHNDDDEYIELYNPGATPVDLSGWQIANRWSDEVASRRYTFREGSYLGGGQRLVLWRTDIRFYLEDEHDYVRLLTANEREIDRVDWYGWNGGSIGRDDEAGDWQDNSVASPGTPYIGLYGTGTKPPEPDPAPGQAGGPPGSLAQAKRYGLERVVEFDAIVTAPPGLFNSSIYVADRAIDGVTGGLGIQLYLRKGEWPALALGDRVRVRGVTTSFRGEMEVALDGPDQIWRLGSGPALQPLPVMPAEIDEWLEGRLVTFAGVVAGYQGDSIFLIDPANPDAEPVRVTVRSSLDWRRPYVNEGERFIVMGIVSQFAPEKPWNGGYRVLVRYPEDLVEDE
jgi:hypothetical protein